MTGRGRPALHGPVDGMKNRKTAVWILIGGALSAGAGIGCSELVNILETNVLNSGSQTANFGLFFWLFESLAVLCRMLTLAGIGAFSYAIYALWAKTPSPKANLMTLLKTLQKAISDALRLCGRRR